MGMAVVLTLPENRPMPGERWKLGPCGCIGIVGQGAMNQNYTVNNTLGPGDPYFTYYLEEDVWNCNGDPNRAHWGLDPNAPGTKRIETLPPSAG